MGYRRTSAASYHRYRRQTRRRRWRLADPRFYLGAAVVIASVAVIVLPAISDAAFAVVRPAAADAGACRIYQVIDGDTVRMWCTVSGHGRARLSGFDAPELFSPACASEFVAAARAQWALRLALWQARKVTLAPAGRDRYGRALVAAVLDGEPLARRMIAAGHARPYGGGQRQGWCA